MNRLITIIITSLTLSSSAFGQVGLGMRVCNNHWNDQWVLSPAPEINYVSKWFMLSMDGTLGYFHPSDAPESTVFISRASLVPMLKLQLGPFFVAAGYGASHHFRREDLLGAGNSPEIVETSKIMGEGRALIGMNLKLKETFSLMIKGGYNIQDADHRYFSASAGFIFHAPSNHRYTLPEKTVARAMLNTKTEPILSSEKYKKLIFIPSDDPIVTEMNRSMESVFMARGIESYSWPTLKQKVLHQFSATEKDPERKLHLLPPVELAVQGAEILDIDLILDTKMRYNYKTYGGDIFIQSASVRLIRAMDGKVLWTGALDGSNKKLPQVKEMMTTALLEQFSRL